MKSRNFATAIILAWVIIGNSCASNPSTKLPVPSRPLLPAISAQEFIPEGDHFRVSKDTVEKIFRRDYLRREYAEQLEAVINANNRPH